MHCTICKKALHIFKRIGRHRKKQIIGGGRSLWKFFEKYTNVVHFWVNSYLKSFHFSKLAGSVHTFFLSKDVFGSYVFCTLTSLLSKSAIDKRFILWVVTYMKGSMTKANSFSVHNIKHRTKNWRNNRYFLRGLWVKRVKSPHPD